MVAWAHGVCGNTCMETKAEGSPFLPSLLGGWTDGAGIAISHSSCNRTGCDDCTCASSEGCPCNACKEDVK